MEEDTPLRRSSRSRSRTPSSFIISQVVDGERVQGMREAAIRIEKYQAIREVVIEGHNEITVSSSSTRTVVSNGDTGLNNNSSLEAHQNAINLSQESLKKKKPTKTADDKSRRTVRLSKKSSTNGGSPSKKKATKSQSDISEPSQEETPLGAPSSSKSQTRSRSTKTSNGSSELTYESYMTTKASPKASPQARRLHENAMSGEYNSDNSVFLKFYRNVGEWWNFYKKTDYTYSPLSAQRYEIAPGFYNMPNLSRRAIGSYSSSVSRMQQNFAYNLSREDSDSEEFVDPRRWRYEEQHEHRQFGLFRRIWTTIYSLLVIIYAYTIGVVVTGAVSLVNRVRSFFSARNTRDTRNYYYYKETSTLISDAERTEEAHAWTEKFLLFFAWIYSAITRNWGKLLLLLLLLLLGYSLYTGDFHKIKGDLSEKVSKLPDKLSVNFFEMTEGVKTMSLGYYQVMWNKWNETDFKHSVDWPKVPAWPVWLELPELSKWFQSLQWPEWLPILDRDNSEPVVDSLESNVEQEYAVPTEVTIEEPVVA